MPLQCIHTIASTVPMLGISKFSRLGVDVAIDLPSPILGDVPYDLKVVHSIDSDIQLPYPTQVYFLATLQPIISGNYLFEITSNDVMGFFWLWEAQSYNWISTVTPTKDSLLVNVRHDWANRGLPLQAAIYLQAERSYHIAFKVNARGGIRRLARVLWKLPNQSR